MRHLHLVAFATCLAIASPVMAQGTANRSWTGDALRFTPSSIEGCNVTLMEAATYGGVVNVTLRNGGTAALNYTIGGALTGNGQRSIGTATTRLPVGQNIRVPLMRVWVGSLAGSILTVSGTACAQAG